MQMSPNSCSSYYNRTNCLQRSMDSALDPRKVSKPASLAGTRAATDTSRRWFAAATEEPVRQIPSSSSRPGSALETDMSTARWVYTHFFVWGFVNNRGRVRGLVLCALFVTAVVVRGVWSVIRSLRLGRVPNFGSEKPKLKVDAGCR